MTMQQFGGDWTEKKLQCLRRYLEAYTTALKNQPFTTYYIDAFAGTGYRETRLGEQGTLFPELVDDASEPFRKGSVKLALEINPQFDEYIFVEANSNRFTELKRLKNEFASSDKRITLYEGHAEEVIRELCNRDWIKEKRRGVIFLDPFGMNVSWNTLVAIAQTSALDLWLLFPLGVGVNRMVTKSGKIPEHWQEKLNGLFGTDQWQKEFYRTSEATQLTLFGASESTSIEKSVDCSGILRYFNERLRTIFAGVAENPLMLRNSKNNPIYALCFAVGNQKGKDIALRIAQYVLKG